MNNLTEQEHRCYIKALFSVEIPIDLELKITAKYDESHRHYHTLKHITEILSLIESAEKNIKSSAELEFKALKLAALFHNIIYDPKSSTNEDNSANYYLELRKDIDSEELKKIVVELIHDTKTHTPKTYWGKMFCSYDLAVFGKPFDQVIEYEKKIRKEYQFVDWDVYKKERIEILTKFLDNDIIKDSYIKFNNIKNQILYLQAVSPNIAVYPGSFEPFHIGHLNILQKAEKIFDKVIVAFGHNPEKAFNAEYYHKSPLKELNYRQVDFYNGMLTDYLKTKNYPITVIRGLRNTTDMQAELNQYRWLQELTNNNINVVSIFCDKEYEHISSTAIRNLKPFGEQQYKKYLVE